MIHMRKAMGNNSNSRNMRAEKPCSSKTFTPVGEFQFHEPFAEDLNNGLVLNDIYIPEEVVLTILSFVDPHKLLNATLVCKKWCNLIKSDLLWRQIYIRYYPKSKPKHLPWFVYYNLLTTKNFENLIKNGCGEQKFSHWKITCDMGDKFKVEASPVGSEPLPENIPDFNGRKSCFVTSYGKSIKIQVIKLEKNRLFRLILNRYKPHIYVSEWVAGRFDCSCVYMMTFTAFGQQYLPEMHALEDNSDNFKPTIFEESRLDLAAGEGVQWRKVELLIKDYEDDIATMIFQHAGCDSQFWKGHYGSKMAGAVVKVLFNSIEHQDPC